MGQAGARWAEVAWAGLSVLLAAGCARDDGPARPSPPDVSALVQTFAMPTGRLTPDTAQVLLDTLPDRLTELGDVLGLITLGTGAVDALTSGLDTAEGELRVAPGIVQTEQALTVDAGGWLVLTRRCPGWGEAEGRGTLQLTALAENDTGLSEVIWGEARRCLALRAADASGAQAQLRYDARITLQLPGFDLTQALVQIAGDVQVDGVSRAYDMRTRFGDGLVYLSQGLPDGTQLLVGVDTQALEGAMSLEDLLDGLRIQDAGGEWRCTVTGCTGPGGEVSW